MRSFIIPALALSAALGAAGAAEARTASASCADAIRRLEATPLHSRAAIEQVGRAKSAFNAGSPRDCLAHARQARQLEQSYAAGGSGRSRDIYSGSSTPPRATARLRSSDDYIADELNRRELLRHGVR